MISAATGGSVVTFSNRFSLSSMNGVFPASVTAALQTVTGTAGPEDQDDITAPQAGAAAAAGGTNQPAAGADVYNVPYTMQTAPSRYAPMPPMAKSKITAKAMSRLHATSAYTVYQTNIGSPNAVTTQTQSFTYSFSSVENPATPAGQPSDAAMQKFLNRWKD